MRTWLQIILVCAVAGQTQDLVRNRQGKVIPWWQRWNSLSAKEKTYYGHNRNGNRYVEHNDFPKAMAEYNEMIRLNPRFPDGYNMRAMLYYRMQRYDQAIADWNKSIPLEKRPRGTAASFYNRGLNYRMKRDWDKAISDFTRSLNLGDVNSDAYRLRGEMYQMKNQNVMAIADFDRAINLDPRSVDVHLKRAQAYSKTHQYKNALIDTTFAMHARPGDPEVLGNHAWALYEAGRIGDAIVFNRKALALAPSLGYVLYNQALCFASKNDWPAAQKQYQSALSKSPAEAKLALDDVRTALRANPKNAALKKAEGILSRAAK